MNAFAKSFELSSCAASRVRAEDPEPGRAERVDDAGGERRLGTDDRQRDLLLVRERDQVGDVRDRDVGKPGLARGAGVARRDEHLRHARRLRDLPSERVLATAATDDQDVHAKACRDRSCRRCRTRCRD
jgi:hypothetical protein